MGRAELIELMKKQINNGHNIFITGAAGTGKTHTTKSILENFPGKVVMTASTGVAALNISGVTLHSFAGTGIHSEIEYLKTMRGAANWSKVKSRIQDADIIVIEECSMIRRDLFELVDKVFQASTGLTEPFGGKQIIAVADFLQLPPVVKRGEIIKNPWPFQSSAWKEANFKTIHLKKTFRQEDKVFIKALNQIRRGHCPTWVDELFRARSGVRLRTSLEPIRFLSTNNQVDEYNFLKLDQLPEKEFVFEAKTWGQTEHLRQQVVRDCIAPETLVLKKGAQVMVLKNDQSCSRYINGSLGKVVGFSKSEGNHPMVRIEKTGQVVKFKEETWKREDYQGNELASFKQIPLKLAYAVTIHKSQGLTLDLAEVNCDGIFSPGQTYVALSRVRSLDGLKLLNWDRSLVAANEDALRFEDNGFVWK